MASAHLAVHGAPCGAAESSTISPPKGDPSAPQCGFSAQVVSILDRLIPGYASFDVLSDPEIRNGIKDFSEWPTIPQLYVKGEFVGGCDIIREMFEAGELQKLLEEKGVEFAH